MSKHSFSVRRAAVEEEMSFPSKGTFEGYCLNMDFKQEPYNIVSVSYEADGRCIVVMRKRYGEYPFLGDPDAPSVDPNLLESVRKFREEAKA